jgi:hypothetical protein
MNERLTELYRSCRPKEALASQDQFQSANALLGSEVEKFAIALIKECAHLIETREPRDEPASHIYLLKKFGVEE